MSNNKNAFLLPLLLLTFTGFGVILGRILTTNTVISARVESQEGFSSMKDIIDVIDSNYVDAIDREKIFETTIATMLHKLDPHSNYIPGKDMKLATEQMEGKFGGVGIRFSVIRDTLCVMHIIPNSPSERAGIKDGDKILRIDGKFIAGKKTSNEKIMGMLKGDPETSVNVTVLRGKQQLNKQITRDVIAIESIVCATMLDSRTGYIRLDQFSITSGLEFHEAALKLNAQGMKKLIFDLRDNPGGVMESAAQICDEFLKKGLKIVEVKGKHIPYQLEKSTERGVLENTEVVVLMNDGSASASEIVAGALQDNDRGIIIGRRSFGKGLVQRDFPLRDGSNLRLTIARYYTPTGRSIQKPFDGSIENYYHDQDRREKNGEYFAPDTSLMVDSLKFKTPKGRIVYGGGGIMPDIFVPLDTSDATNYYVQLRYSPAFQNFAFDFLRNKRSNWKTISDYNRSFVVTPKILDAFTSYAQKELKVKFNAREFQKSKLLISRVLKAEIARQLFLEQGYFTVNAQTDKEIQRAMSYLRTGK